MYRLERWTFAGIMRAWAHFSRHPMQKPWFMSRHECAGLHLFGTSNKFDRQRLHFAWPEENPLVAFDVDVQGGDGEETEQVAVALGFSK